MDNTLNIINLGTWQDCSFLNPNYPPEKIKRSREERALSIVQQSKTHGFACRFWEGEIAKQGFIGISRSFKRIVQWAKENNLERVHIGEDDLLFSAPGAWQYYLENIPESYDIFYGGIYAGEIENNRIKNGYSGHTLITVHNRFYDFFLSIKESDHCDRQLGNFAFEKEFIVCSPFVVYQIPDTYSDNHRKVVSHEEYLKEMKFFVG